ncbi:MAG: sodium/proline symporter [Myxococcota bacterium]|nr:sodium/proline symporter [Myxococcota bacterium]
MDLNMAKWLGVASYLAILIVIGVLASRRMKDVRDFFAAGKSLSYWTTAFSARATGESAWLLLGLTGMGAALGVHAFWVVVGEVLGVAGAWLLMSRRFKRLTDVYDSITIPDYLAARFRDTSHVLRTFSAAALVVFVTIYVSAQIDATGKAFEQFLQWHYLAGALVGFAVVMVYCVSGGFLAVAWSDVFQGALMFLGLVMLPILGFTYAGGPDVVVSGLRAIDPHLLHWSGQATWSLNAVLSAIALSLVGLGFLGSPQIFVRFLALRDEREISRGASVAIVWTLLADSGAVLTGLVGRHLLTTPGQSVDSVLGSSGEDVLPDLVHFFHAEGILPALLVGIVIAIVLSAIMSTVDSLLVVASSAAVRDYYQQVRKPGVPDDQLVGLSRTVTLGLAGIALAVALSVAYLSPTRSVFWFVIFGWSGIAATFCPTMILSLYWSRMTARGALAAMVTGFIAVPLFKFGATQLPRVGDHFATLSELPPAFLASFLAGILVSRLDAKNAPADADAELIAAAGPSASTES